MPKVFEKGQKITVIQYGEHCSEQVPWKAVKEKVFAAIKTAVVKKAA